MFFWTLFLASLLGWGSWVVVLYKLSPFSSPEWALSLFFLSLFLALSTTFSLLFYVLRRKSATLPHTREMVNSSLRQGLLVASMICLAALLQRLRVLTWWNATLLFLIVLLLEFYWVGRAKR